jgi:hypothetical protein
MSDAEHPRTVRNGRRTAAGDPRDDDAGVVEQMNADAVQCVKGLGLASFIVDVDAPVGQHAVDIARHQSDATGALVNLLA